MKNLLQFNIKVLFFIALKYFMDNLGGHSIKVV